MTSSSILERIQTLLKQTKPFGDLPDDVRGSLLSDITIEYFQDGDVIIEQGSTTHRGLYIVESGTVRIMNVDDQHLLKKCGEGDQFGAFPIIKRGASIYEAKAVEPTVCALLSTKRFVQLLDEQEVVSSFFENDIQQYLRRMETYVDVGGAHLLFSRRLEELGLPTPITCEPEHVVRDVARLMTKNNTDAVLVKNSGRLVGILTDSDIRRRVVGKELPYDTPVRKIMSRPVATITSDASLFDAVMRMLDRRVNRLVVIRKEGRVYEPLGILTDRDIAHFRGKDPLATAAHIDHLKSPTQLTSIREEVNEQLQSLFEQGVSPEQLGRLVATLYDRFAVRAIEMIEREMRASSSLQSPNLSWVWLRLGSSGRQETVLNSEQHNALLYDNPSTEKEAELAAIWFRHLAERVSETLSLWGFPMSDLIASDPRYCKSLTDWKRQFREWILQAGYQGVEESLRFFDLRSIYGKTDLLRTLKQHIEDALNVQAFDSDRHFLKLMAEHAMSYSPPRTFFERYVRPRTGEGNVPYDLRVRGILPVVEIARVLAIDLRYLESTNTFDRLRFAMVRLPEIRGVLEAALDAYRNMVDLRLEHQLNQVEGGAVPTNEIDVSSLSRLQQQFLHRSSSAVTELQEAIAKRYRITRKRSRIGL